MTQKNWCRTVLHQFSGFIEPEILLGRAVRRGSLPLARGRTGRLSAAQLRDGGLGRHLFGLFFAVAFTGAHGGAVQPPSFAMAAFAAICSAIPEKLRFSGFPYFCNPQAGRARLPARKFPAFSRKFCLDAPFGAARFRSQKRPNWTAFSRPASQWRLSPPFVRPLFCCGLCRSPRGFRSGPPPRKSAYRGRDPPRR